jgi:FkbM family methyltransferase
MSAIKSESLDLLRGGARTFRDAVATPLFRGLRARARSVRAARRTKILHQWQARREAYSGHILEEDKDFIEPYVLSRRSYGHDIDFLVVNRQGQAWYDKLSLLVDFQLWTQFGMVEPGDVVFDCGAHHGFYALTLSRMVGPRGKVYTFEPFPILSEVIALNKELNRADNIELFRVGLSNKAEKRRASVNAERILLAGEQDAVDIRLDVLDNYAHLKPNFVKLDIEGAEVDALEGARKLLEQKPNLYIEIHGDFLPYFKRRAMEIFDFVSPNDYNMILSVPRQPMQYYHCEFPIEQTCALYCVRKDIEFFKRTTL